MTLAAPAPVDPVSFHGRRWALAAIVVRNGLLNIMTLGLYRFWAKTRMRRHFWNNLAVRGDPLEYTGRATELLLGFLIVLAILVPVGLFYSGVEFVITSQAPEAEMAVQFAYTAFLLFLTPYALYRARRYRLTRTNWRGIRFGQDGSAGHFTVLTVAYWTLALLTLGLAYPVMRTGLQRFKINHTRFGDRLFAFDGGGAALLPAWLLFYSAFIVTIVLLVVATMGPAQLWFMVGDADDAEAAKFIRAVLGDGYLIAAGIAAVAAVFLFIRYRTVEFRYFVAAMRFDDIRFSARPHTATVALIAVAYLVVWVMALVAILLGVGIVAIAISGGAGLALQPVYVILTVMLTFFIVMPLVKYVVLYHAMLSHVCKTFEISDLDAVDAVVQTMRQSPRFGEGLADALDIDMGAI